MASNYLKDSLPWLVPSAAIAFAAFVFSQGDFGALTANNAGTASVAAPEPLISAPDAEEVVARQASPDTSLSDVAAAPAESAPVVAAVEPPAPEPEPAPVREASVSPIPTVAPVFDSSTFRAGANGQCVEDLKSTAAQARVYFPSGGLNADASGIEQGRLLGLIAQNCPGVQIRVDGHSDASGDPTANLRLSERRALEVIKRIGASGIDTSKFVARGMGDRVPSGVVGARPSAYYDRRVEFAIVEEVSRVALRSTASVSPWANASCVTDLQRAVDSTVLLYAPRSVSLRPEDLDTAVVLAEMAVECPHARLRVIGQHAGGVQTGEDVRTGRLRAKALMTMLVGRGIEADQIIIAAPSRPKGFADATGLPGSRVDFDVILEEE